MPLLTLKNTPLHPLTLRFPEELEQGFQEEYYAKSIKQIRIVYILGILLFAVFGFLDEYIVPEVKHITWFIRYAVFCPIAFLFFLLTYLPIYKKIMQIAISFVLLLSATCVIASMVIRKPFNDQFDYHPSFMIIILVTCTCCSLRFIYASTVSLVAMLMYVIFAVAAVYPPFDFWSSNAQLLSLFVMASFASYQIERRTRENYLQKLIIDDERKKIEAMRYALEKEKIVNNLHDGIGGIITNINLLSEMAVSSPDIKDPQTALMSVSELSRECLSEIRTFIDALDMKDKTWNTLFADMRHFGKSMLESHGISLTFDACADDGHLQPEALVAINLMRIYKEALANVIKHSKAQAVRVTLNKTRECLALSVSDNGTWKEKNLTAGRGLMNMQARARDLNGTLTLHHVNGTELRLEFPLSESGGISP